MTYQLIHGHNSVKSQNKSRVINVVNNCNLPLIVGICNINSLDYELLVGRSDCMITPDRWQWKTLVTIDESGSQIARNSIFDCHLAIENVVSNYFLSTFVDSINTFDCRLFPEMMELVQQRRV